MSIPVSLDQVRAAIAERGGAAYLLTVSEDGRAHAVHAPVRWEGEQLIVEVGRRSAANAAARPAVSLLWPVRHTGDYSLIVDGTAVVATADDSRRVLVTPEAAVLHRARTPADPGSTCGADCVPLLGK